MNRQPHPVYKTQILKYPHQTVEIKEYKESTLLRGRANNYNKNSILTFKKFH